MPARVGSILRSSYVSVCGYCILQQLCSAYRQYHNGLSAAYRLLDELQANHRFATLIQVGHSGQSLGGGTMVLCQGPRVPKGLRAQHNLTVMRSTIF